MDAFLHAVGLRSWGSIMQQQRASEVRRLTALGMDESEALTVASRELIEEVGERLLELVKMGASDEAASP